MNLPETKLLFSSIDEIRQYAPFVYANTEFEELRHDIILGAEELCNIIGSEIYNRAIDNVDNSQTDDIDKWLISYIRYPLALLTYISFASNSDISHEGDGRRVKIDKERESMPWQWQIERDDAALRLKAEKGIERLIKFLDANLKFFPEWETCEQRKDINSLFVSSALVMNTYVPIDASRAFYIRCLPFIRAEESELGCIIGSEKKEELLQHIVDRSLSDKDASLVNAIRRYVSCSVMAKAIRCFSVSVLPESVTCRFEAPGQTQKASAVPTIELLSRIENSYISEANGVMATIQNIITPPSAEINNDFGNTTGNRKDKFFSV